MTAPPLVEVTVLQRPYPLVITGGGGDTSIGNHPPGVWARNAVSRAFNWMRGLLDAWPIRTSDAASEQPQPAAR